MSKTLASNIRLNRKNRGLTQLSLSEMLYVSPQTISKWESGASEPDAEKLCRLADIFGISLDTLVRNRGEEEKRAFIAVDGGGTKTEFLLFYENGKIIDGVTLEGSNPNVCGMERVKSILTEGIDRMIKNGNRVEGLFAGISGASGGDNREVLNRFLAEKYPYFKSRVEGDIHNVINSVDGDERCVAVICGTGSVAYAYDGDSLRRFGGWGYLFDDAGSGFDMGRDLIKHVLLLEDLGESDEISAVLYEKIGGKVFEHISEIYSGGKDYIASFAPMVFELYDNGNSVAEKIVEKCVSRLSELILQAKERANCGDNVIVSGGLTSRRDILEPLISERLGDRAKLIFPTAKPIVGAEVKCLKLYGTSVNFNGIKDGYSKFEEKDRK